MSESTEAIVRALGLPVTDGGSKAQPDRDGRTQLAILEDLRRGRMSPEDALLRLRQHGAERGERR